MTKSIHTTNRSQAGFTLVELAVVMIIIGLLIGGVLKGQELITNAQITATVAQLKGIEASTSSFRDSYAALPGDMRSPNTRLPNCSAAPCSTAGDGNGRLNTTPAANPTAGEAQRFFVHLGAADMITGIIPGSDTPGGNFPAGKLNNTVIQVGYAGSSGDLAGATSATNASAGHYLVINGTVGAAAATALRPVDAMKIDTKLDDGMPNTGSVRAVGSTADCGDANGYVSANADADCGLYIRIQG